MNETMLFYIGVLVPAIITVILFIIFLWCLYRMRVRRKIMTKRYAPHAKGWPGHKDMSPPPLPSHPPPVRSHLWEMKVIPTYDMDTIQTLEHGSPRVTFETRFDSPTELDDVGDLASRRQDSGISELSDIHSKRGRRPYSQASTDSDDSGFRSSRSAHYLQKSDNHLSTYQDVPLLKALNQGSKREEMDRSPISFTENIQITDYLAPTCTNVVFHPYYGNVNDMPHTEIHNTCDHSQASGQNNQQLDYNAMVRAGFLHLSGPSLTTTTAMVHNLSDDNEKQKVYSVV